MKRFLLAGLLVLGLCAQAQADSHVVIVTPRGETAMEQVFLQELRRRVGPVRVTLIKSELANAADMRSLPARVRAAKPTVIYSWGTPTTLALAGTHDAPQIADIPIVFTVVADPLRARLVKDLKVPGRNVTGSSHLAPLSVQLTAMREFKPFKILGVVYNPTEPNVRYMLEDLSAEAKRDGFQLVTQAVGLMPNGQPDPKTLDAKIKLVKEQGADWLYIGPDSFVGFNYRKLSTGASIEAKLPAFTANESAIRDGHALFGLFSPVENLARFTALKVSQILKNERKVSEIPIETLQRFSTVVNLCSAIALNVFPPPAIFKIADVIVPTDVEANIEDEYASGQQGASAKGCRLARTEPNKP